MLRANLPLREKISLFLAHLAQSAKVRFWDDPLSVVLVVRRPSSTIYLNIFFSETTDEKVIKLGTDVP